ncbi:hypothetical protein FMUND_13319 [Fusarium mundagurra]|uniref:Uncharacterized protein n=1 Tax=Fusarium mundagurra TaxID=1567541 RepID=A0A8H6D401_9HYPO|nr:hypothetical protein FMUND_13319 [Fusarium mundagurra]
MRSASQYQRHVGRHQEQLALFALPTVESDDKDEIGSESDSSAGSMVMIDSQDERGDDTKQPEEPPTSHSMPGTDENSAMTPNDLRRSNRRIEYFLRREGIDREVIAADICRYLGNDAVVRHGHHKEPHCKDLEADSAQWGQEKEEKLSRDRSAHVQYLHSEVHRNRQLHGPREQAYKP